MTLNRLNKNAERNINPRNAGRRPDPKYVKPENCPACGKPMNICTEEKDLFYCPGCLVHVRNSEIVTVDYKGNYQPPLGHVGDKAKLRVVGEDEQQEEQDEPQNLDFYFRSGDKKCFKNLIARSMNGPWMVLEKPDGKVVMVNSDNVNYCEEM